MASSSNFKEIFEIDLKISHDDCFGLNVTSIRNVKHRTGQKVKMAPRGRFELPW